MNLSIKYSFLQSFSAELLKVKSSVGFWVAIIAPFIQGFIHFCVFFFNGKNFIKANTDIWGLFIHSIWGFWAVLFLPLIIGIQTSLVNGLEHQTEGWRNLFCLPIPRWYVYLSKILMCLLLIFISNALLVPVTVFVGYLLGFLEIGDFIHQFLPNYLWLYPFVMTIGAFLIIAFHWAFSLVVRNFFVCAGLAVVLTLFNIIISNEKDISIYSPWCFPIASTEFLSNIHDVTSFKIMIFSLLSGSVLIWLTIAYKGKQNVI
jgi:hypothetical protein